MDNFSLQKRVRRNANAERGMASNFIRNLAFDLSEHIEFFRAFIRKPAAVGAVSPSSQFLAKEMIEGFALGSADTVVEMGPGTGAFTGLILERIGDQTTFISMELDAINARRLRRRFPQVMVYNDAADKIARYLAFHGKRKADYVICGLPWASLPLPTQQSTLNAVLESLAPDGVFSTFAYVHARMLPKAKQFQKRLQQHFTCVETSPVVWRNLPPAFVYRCSKVSNSLFRRPS